LRNSVDFVTLRVLKGNLSTPLTVEKGVHGFLYSRDDEERLAEFL
jgi:hypothetical protein